MWFDYPSLQNCVADALFMTIDASGKIIKGKLDVLPNGGPVSVLSRT